MAQTLADRIIEDLEAGNIPPWRKPWRMDTSLPRNALTGKAYRGANVWSLLMTSMVKGYSDPRWMTYGQAETLGGNVRKGEKSTAIWYFQPGQKETENEKGKPPFWKTFSVFNVAQTDGCKVADLPEVGPAPDPIEAAEAIVAGMPNPPRIIHDGSRACYSPALDLIQLPKVADFDSIESYHATKFHEVGHSTGHVNRLGRTGVVEGQHFGSDGYGREELVAEMTSALLSAECGIAPATIENSTAYLASWIRTIKEDPRVILTAAAQAQRAVDFILRRSPTTA